MLLIVSASAAISPFASTSSFCFRSPFATCRHDLRDASHLVGEVAGHEVHRVGEIFPRAADALHDRLAAELSFRAYFAGYTRYFRGEGVQLIHHRVDGVLQLEDLAFDVDGDLLRKIAARDRVVTAAMLRTCVVRFDAMKFTESVRSFHVPETPRLAPVRRALLPSLPRAPHALLPRRTIGADPPSC
jgi:hypothetical protein